jgi:IS5 family transposase/transposase
MLGKREAQTDLFTADTQYLRFVGEESFYGFLARHGRELFRDEDFAQLYCLDNGRTSVPPSRLCLALLLQTHDRVSDEEAKARADFDLRWKVALGIGIDTRPFAKSTLQLFRAQLVIHEEAQTIFRRSLEYAKGLGYLRGRRMRAALDSTHVLGRGAVEDTYNLIAEGIRVLSRAVAKAQGEAWEGWLGEHALSRYAEASIKGAAEVEWEEAASREAFLTGLIQDGERMLEITRHVRIEWEEGSEADRRVAEAAALLTTLLWQDVEPTERGYRIKQGTAKDRIPSAHDPEQRHGHKSRGKSFTGHKAAIAVDAESQLITAVEVVAGNASDAESAVPLVEASEANTGCAVAQVIGDSAYGSMEGREALGEREVIAPTVKSHAGQEGRLTKADFVIDTEHDVVRCPMGHETRTWGWGWVKPGVGQEQVRTKRFVFAKEVCRACPRSGECVTGKRRPGRQITLHPQEAKLQAARAFEQTEYFQEQYRQRVVVEHRLARLIQLGMRQARSFGRAKTQVQFLLAATVANLTLLAGRGAAPAGEAAEARVQAVWRAMGVAVTTLGALLRARFGRTHTTVRSLLARLASCGPCQWSLAASGRGGSRPDL